jgi:hypothetical protein
MHSACTPELVSNGDPKINSVKPMKQAKPYVLRDTSNKSASYWSDPKIWCSNRCAVCGHHLPVDQVMQVGSDLVHTDVRICLALINKSGGKPKKYKKDLK